MQDQSQQPPSRAHGSYIGSVGIRGRHGGVEKRRGVENLTNDTPPKNAWWTFRIFFIFSCSGRGKRESEAAEGGGVRFFIENPRRGVPRRERGRGAGRVSAENWGICGGGLNIFFRG